MKKNILATAAGLSDQDLLARLELLAEGEREAAPTPFGYRRTLPATGSGPPGLAGASR